MESYKSSNVTHNVTFSECMFYFLLRYFFFHKNNIFCCIFIALDAFTHHNYNIHHSFFNCNQLQCTRYIYVLVLTLKVQ